MVRRARFGHAVERIAVGLPLLLRAGLVLRSDLLPADQDALAQPQVDRVECRIVLDDRLDRDFVPPRNGVERLALLHRMEVEGPAQLAVGQLFGDARHEGNLEDGRGLQSVGRRGVVLQDDLFAHVVALRQRIERLTRLHGVDIVFRPVDVDDRRGLLRRRGAEAPEGEQGGQAESLHRHFVVLSRMRISVITFFV